MLLHKETDNVCNMFNDILIIVCKHIYSTYSTLYRFTALSFLEINAPVWSRSNTFAPNTALNRCGHQNHQIKCKYTVKSG